MYAQIYPELSKSALHFTIHKHPIDTLSLLPQSLSIVSVSLLAMTSPADFSYKAFIGILQVCSGLA